MSTLYVDLVNMYGKSDSIDEVALKVQFVGAMNYKSIWEVWNYNKFGYGDRWTSGFLYWYHNSAVRQVCGRMWDWSLEPTAALYAAANACEPLHPQFDYLKNTVSVVNDYYKSFKGYKVIAEVWDIDSKKVWSKAAVVDLPEDGVANDVFVIDFPENISPVHFIKLRLLDEEGQQVGSNFYWRSDDVYEGKKTLTGPTTSGFETISDLDETRVSISKMNVRTDDRSNYIDLTLKNSRKAISFFTQIQWLDSDGKPVRPSYYTDNFFSMMPGESRTITIETAKRDLPAGEYTLVVKGFNTVRQEMDVHIQQ